MQNPGLGIPNGAIWCKLWPKTILEGTCKNLGISQGANPVFKQGNPVSKKGNPAFKKGDPAFKKGTPAFKKGTPAFKKGNPVFKKGNPATRNSRFQEGKSCNKEFLFSKGR